ncbi:MAG: 2-hydroxyacyl-CoA dehydratase family protein [Dehalococcoidia bacterium]|nr:2-hydroxyacyl-CoA dehydratase family protein [Dehalococcoidia bacterium]
MIMHLNRGCEGLAQYQLELQSTMLAAGIPVLAYEGNMADKRELDERQVVDRVEAFMESLGLTRCEKWEEGGETTPPHPNICSLDRFEKTGGAEKSAPP